MWKLFLLLFLFKINASDAYRLANNTQPEAYHIILEFGEIESETEFKGEVFIEIKIIEDTNNIIIHSAVDVVDPIILCKNFTTNCPNPLNLTSIYDDDREFLQISTSDLLLQNEVYFLYIEYAGKINNLTNKRVNGVYQGSYSAENDDINFFLATHMQPTHARKVFPCFDEPKFKAKFYLTLIHGDQYDSIANMDTETQISRPNQTVKVFKPTPLLSTYLIAFVVSKFENLTVHNITEFRTFSREGQIENTEFGLKTAVEALNLFQSTFNVTYDGMTKLDQVALPIFNLEAMENHGIIFYREDFFLYNDSINTAYDKEYVAQIVVHEVCHQFLGNRLTPNWWSVLWLSEGFCEFYEYYMAQQIYSDMRTDELFVVEILQDVMISDASSLVRPMTFYVEKPNEISEAFDSIAYSKSACVLRMLMYALSKKVFNEGLNIYLTNTTENPQGVVEPGNLYSALQQALPNDSIVNVTSVMETWETQSGFPYIFVERNYFGNQTNFTQSRFLNVDEVDNSLWHIPITYSTSVDNFTKVEEFWINEKSMQMRIDSMRPNNILIVNIDQRGYYRVLYDDANWMLIADFLYNEDFRRISPTTRSMLIADAGIFVLNEQLDVRIFLEILKYLEKEDDWIPWYTATEYIWYMERMLHDGVSQLNDDFRKFLRKIFQKVYNTYGSEIKDNEPHHHKHIRNIAINWACHVHLPECLNDTQRLFNQALNNKTFNFLPNDHRSEIMCGGVLGANETVYETLMELYNTPGKSDSERILLLETIGCIENKEILTKYIKEYGNVTDDWVTLIQSVFENGPIGMNVAVTFLKEHFMDFNQFIIDGDHQSSLNSIFEEIANHVNTKKLKDELINLMVRYGVDEAVQTSAYKTMTENLMMIENYKNSIQEFLDYYFNHSGKLMVMWPLILSTLLIKLIL